MQQELKFSEKDVENYLCQEYQNSENSYWCVDFVRRQVSLGDYGIADLVIGRTDKKGYRQVTVVEIKAFPPALKDLAQLTRYLIGAHKHSPDNLEVLGELVALPYTGSTDDFPFMCYFLSGYIEYRPYHISLEAGFVWDEPFRPEIWRLGSGYIGKEWSKIMQNFAQTKHNKEVTDADPLHQNGKVG